MNDELLAKCREIDAWSNKHYIPHALLFNLQILDELKQIRKLLEATQHDD